MPPKIKVTKEDIIKASIELTRSGGEQAINARTLAALLNCSTQPIFSNFASMDELQRATIHACYDIYQDYLKREVERGEYPKYKAFGMAYIRFAKEEKELFRLLFMCDRKGKDLIPTKDFDESVEMIMQTSGVSRETAMLLHLEMWTFVHGIATMMATSFLLLDWELISEMLSDVYHGIRARYVTEGKNDACN